MIIDWNTALPFYKNEFIYTGFKEVYHSNVNLHVLFFIRKPFLYLESQFSWHYERNKTLTQRFQLLIFRCLLKRMALALIMKTEKFNFVTFKEL